MRTRMRSSISGYEKRYGNIELCSIWKAERIETCFVFFDRTFPIESYQ